MKEQQSRNLKAIASDIAEGFISVNPIFLKSFSETDLKELHAAMQRKQREIRTEAFPFNDAIGIRKRNMRLQRLHAAAGVIRNFSRERKVTI